MSNFMEITGTVIHGNGKGKTVGMPTANLEYDTETMFLQEGVYATEVSISEVESNGTMVNNKYIGVTNIGRRPSVDNYDAVTIETNILDFDKDIYGKKIKLRIIGKIRDVIKFNSLQEVKEQVDKDKEVARELYNK